MSIDDEPDILRSDVLGLLDSDPVPPPSAGLLARTRDVARQLARRAGGHADLPPGARVGPYVVREVLGHGGQATVYRADDDEGRPVALKVPRPELVARMVREAQILFHLDHPRIVRIERAVIDADPPYIACELLPGGTLADRLRAAGRLPAAEVAAIANQILVALQHGHEKGVVHRDIKPSNVLFDADGLVKVADFGVGSLRLVEDLGLPQTLVSLDLTRGAGTPIYMAPEQEHVALRDGGKVDGRADLYALGKLLYEALTGRSPRTVRPPSSVVGGLDPRWDAFLFRLLEDRPQDRFSSAAAARDALTQLSLPEPGATPRWTHVASEVITATMSEPLWRRLRGRIAHDELPDPLTGEVVARAGDVITDAKARRIEEVVGAQGRVRVRAHKEVDRTAPEPPRASPPASAPTRVERWRRLWLPLSAATVAGFGLGHLAADPWPLVPLVGVLVIARLGVALAARRGRRADVAPDERAGAHLVDAVWRLSRAKAGALIAVERGDSLRAFVATGTTVDALLRADVLTTIFHPGAPLHDGAVVVRGDRVVAAGCSLPLTDDANVATSLGTRHRAAIGLSEATDALVIAVSEETGQISLAERGRLVRDVEPGEVAAALTLGLAPSTAKTSDASPPRRPTPPPTPPPQVADARVEAPPSATAGTADRRLRRRRLVLHEEDIGRLNAMLREHLNLSNARCALLIDFEGHSVTQVGSLEGIHLETVAALVAASFAATKEVAKALGGDRFSSLTNESWERGVQLSIVGERTILATIFDPQETTGPTVLFYATELVRRLAPTFDEIRARGDDELGRPDDVLDDMFGRP